MKSTCDVFAVTVWQGVQIHGGDDGHRVWLLLMKYTHPVEDVGLDHRGCWLKFINTHLLYLRYMVHEVLPRHGTSIWILHLADPFWNSYSTPLFGKWHCFLLRVGGANCKRNSPMSVVYNDKIIITYSWQQGDANWPLCSLSRTLLASLTHSML